MSPCGSCGRRRRPHPLHRPTCSTPSVVARSFWDRSRLDALIGGAHEELPRYLTHDRERDLIVLAGHDRGEQAFMGQLAAMLLGLEEPTTLVIIAGGKFHLPTDEDFTRQRAVFYRQLAWHPDLNRRMADELADHPDYVALHVRGTDRSLEAPTARTIREGLTALADSTDRAQPVHRGRLRGRSRSLGRRGSGARVRAMVGSGHRPRPRQGRCRARRDARLAAAGPIAGAGLHGRVQLRRGGCGCHGQRRWLLPPLGHGVPAARPQRRSAGSRCRHISPPKGLVGLVRGVICPRRNREHTAKHHPREGAVQHRHLRGCRTSTAHGALAQAAR